MRIETKFELAADVLLRCGKTPTDLLNDAFEIEEAARARLEVAADLRRTAVEMERIEAEETMAGRF